MKFIVLQSCPRALKGAFHRVFSLSGVGPLSTRTVVLLLFTGYLLLGPVPSHSDIVSAALAYGLLGVLALAFVVVVLQGALMRRRLTVTLVPPAAACVSREPVRAVVVLPRLRVLPFTSLDISLESPISEFPKAALRVSGTSSAERKLALDLTLPHRGSWTISGLRCEVRDAAGLIRLRWRQPVATALEIVPPTAMETRLPLVSSTQRPGDMVTDTLNRQGDPFDIKAYHPSDGIKKIVWKAFAKRGELLSRHPEASMTPEGFVVMLVLARPEDDAVCSAALAYARSVKGLGLDIVMGCEGSSGRSPATSVEQAETLLVDSVWDAQSLSGSTLQADATALLDFCAGSALRVQVRKVMLFCAGSRAGHEADGPQIIRLATWLSAQGIEPILCLTAPDKLVQSAKSRLRERVVGMLVEPSDTAAEPVAAAAYRQFLSECLAKQWEVFV